MTNPYAILPGVRIRFWLGPREGEEGTFLRRLTERRVAVKLDSGEIIAESLGRVEVVIS